MAASPRFKIYREKEYIGSMKHYQDAFLFCHQGHELSIRLSHTLEIYHSNHDSDIESPESGYDLGLVRLNDSQRAYAQKQGIETQVAKQL